MRLAIFIVFSLLLTAVQSLASTIDPQTIQKTLTDAVASHLTVGIVVGIVDAGGRTIYSHGKTAATATRSTATPCSRSVR